MLTPWKELEGELQTGWVHLATRFTVHTKNASAARSRPDDMHGFSCR